jgi:hypothetical protein
MTEGAFAIISTVISTRERATDLSDEITGQLI